MYKSIRSVAAILGGLLYTVIAVAQSTALPAELTGNWLATDGSNRFVTGIYRNVVCYNNDTWTMQPASTQKDHWQLALQNDIARINLQVHRKDSNTIVLTDNNGRQQQLKNIRTYNHRYKPEQQNFSSSFVANGMAEVKGYIHSQAALKQGLRYGYIEISYENELTGETEYFMADIDSLGRFSVSFPVYKPQICTLHYRYDQLAVFVVQPGSNLLIAVNRDIKINHQHPDYSKVMQQVCVMGNDAGFNNHYQHFLKYSAGLGYPEFKFPFETVKGKSAAEKKEAQKAYYKNLYDKCLAVVNYVYPPAKTEQRFIDYIKEEIKYHCAYALLANMRDQSGESSYSQYKVDSNDVQYVYEQFIGQPLPGALQHDSYYRLVRYYTGEMYGNKGYQTWTIQPEKLEARIKNEYAPLLSFDLMRPYEAIKKDAPLVGNMSEEDVIQKYFNGSKEDAYAFRYIFRKITDELFKEVRDSTAYTSYKKELKDPVLRFTANLSQLLHTSRSDDDLDIPSIFRLNLFREYSQLENTPWKLVDSLNRAQTLNLASAGLQAKWDPSLLREVNNEADWQAILKAHQGKTVVVWAFSHYFRKKHVERSLYELHKMQELYRGKNVVFLKCIMQRQRSDKAKQLVSYLRLLEKHNDLNNIIYFDRSVSIGAVLRDAIEECCVIYNEESQAYASGFTPRAQQEITLPGELDLVLSGKGMYYNEMAGHFFKRTSYSSMTTWTQYASAGNYFTYSFEEPDKPLYGTVDTVFNQVSFAGDSLFIEHKLLLHKIPPPKNNDRLFYSNDYRKERVKESEFYKYSYDSGKKLISCYDRNGRLHKQLKIVLMTRELMVLELVQ